MIAEAVGLPLFQGHLGWPVLATIRDRGWEDMHPGAIVIHNDPYDGGGNHLNDVVMFAPYFAEGKPLGFVVTKAHWVDVGGSVPGSMAVDTTEFYQEGLRLHSLKLFQRGEENRDVWRVITANIRTATGVMKDIKAMIATIRIGLRRFQELVSRYGAETLRESWRIMMEQSERRTRKAIAAIPDGTYHAEGQLDNGGIDLDRPLRIGVTVSVKGSDFHVDLSDCEPQVSAEYHVNGHVVRVPVIDIVEVSAGGGSVAWVEEGGSLHIGPQSAGADPGPACYGRGGMAPTLTDANSSLAA